MYQPEMNTTNDFFHYFREHRSAIRMAELRLDRELKKTCDVSFEVDGRVFEAHKCVLVNASRYFSNMLTGSFKESRQRVIKLPDIEEKVFELLLDFIYGAQMDYARTPMDTLLNARRIADMWCLDDFGLEIDAFLKYIPLLNDCGKWYTFAKEMKAQETVNDLKLALFTRLLVEPTESKVTKPIYVKLEDAEFELMLDTLKLFSKENLTPDLRSQEASEIGDLNHPKYIQVRLQGVANWIEFHPNEETDRYFTLTDYLSLENLPMETIQSKIKELLNNDKVLGARILIKQMSKIRQRIDSLRLRATWLRIRGNRVFMANYPPTTKRWHYYETVLESTVVRYAIDENFTYFLTSEGMLDIQDMNTVTFTTPSIPIPLPPNSFDYVDMAVHKPLVYIYAKSTIADNAVLLILNETTEEWSRHDMLLDHYPTAMTISDGKVYLKRNGGIFEYDTETRHLRFKVSRYFSHPYQGAELNVAKVGNDFYVIGPRGFLPVDYLSLCTSDDGLVVANGPVSHPGPVKILLGVGDKFKNIGFLTDPNFDPPNSENSKEESLHFVIRHVSLPKSAK